MHAPSEPAEGSAVLAPVGDRLQIVPPPSDPLTPPSDVSLAAMASCLCPRAEQAIWGAGEPGLGQPQPGLRKQMILFD